MADVEISTLVKGIIAIIILVVVALIIYSAMNFDDIKQIAQQVFHANINEEIKTKTEDSVLAFSSDLEGCYDGNYNPDAKDNCFCYQKTHGSIESSEIRIQNKGSSSEFTTLTANGEPILQFTKPYELGLMATSNVNGYQLGCVFPPQFSIVGSDDTNYENNWYVKWNDDSQSFWSSFTTDTFGFYSDDTSSSLKGAPMLYRIDSTHFCLVTKLIDDPVSYTSSEFVPLSKNLMRITDYNIDPGDITPQIINCDPSASQVCYSNSVQNFLLNAKLYCHKF